MLGQVFLGRTSTKQGLVCLAQGFACWVMFNDSLLPPVFVCVHALACVCVLFKIIFKKVLSEIHVPSVSNSLDPDQAQHFVVPCLDINCLQRLG